jgi:hypothetical protein
MTDLVARIGALRDAATAKAATLKADDPARKRLLDTAASAETLRKEIVATKEGGAITGEERLREYTDEVYGAITSWDGAPSAYQLKRVAALDAQLTAIGKRFDALAKGAMVAVPPTPPAELVNGGGTGDDAATKLAGWRLTAYPR